MTGTTPPIRWAIVGTGPVSHQFAAALKRVPGAVRQAVYSRDGSHAQAFAKRHGFARAAQVGDGMFAAVSDVDVFYIATPTATHRALCLAAIAAGKHVLCEKPMTATADELLEVTEAARAKGVFAMEGMWLRFNPVVQQTRDSLAQGKQGQLGQLLGAHMHVGYAEQAVDQPVRDGLARDALSVFGCYGFSLAHHLFGAPQAIRASGQCDAKGAVLHANVALAYPTFAFNMTTSVVATLSNTLELVGSQGRWLLPNPVLDPYTTRWLPHSQGGAAGKVSARLQAVAHALREQVAFLHPLRGSGFRVEIVQVNASLRSQQTEHPTNPLAATLLSHRMQASARLALLSKKWVPVAQVAARAGQ